MSFFKNPEIDRSSEASEESVIATRAFFCQKNGFLSREENPDKGVDLDVELLTDKQVSGFKFAIQIKSVQGIDRIKKKNKQYLSYSLKTSRLGYLCRRKPGLGIIVLYDVETKKLYFEYVEKIYSRITKEKGNYDWKNNETVKIHIQEKNLLNEASVKNIFRTMETRYLNFLSMYSQNSYDFDLPTFDEDKFKDPLSILEEYGYVFFNKNEYQIIFSIISSLPISKIVNNHKILLLAAVTHYEIGYYVEGDFYANKCQQYQNKYSDEEKEILSLARLSSGFFFGRTERDTYLNSLKQLKSSIKNKMNFVLVRQKILFLEISSFMQKGEEIQESLLVELFSIWEDIEKIDTNETAKQYFLLEIFSFMHQVGILIFINTTSRMAIYRRMFGELPLGERENYARIISLLLSKPFEYLAGVWNNANKIADDYLMAMVLYKKQYMFFGFCLQHFFLKLSEDKSIHEIKEIYDHNVFTVAYDDLITAYNLFIKKMNLANAYKTLTLSLEVDYLYSILYGKSIDQNRFEKIKEIIKDLEGKLGLLQYEIVTDNMIKTYISASSHDPLLAISREEAQQYAKMFVDSVGIPEDRIENILFDIGFCQEASEEINNQYFELLQNLQHTKKIETLYKEKPKYIIKCKGCGYQTDEYNDLKRLLEDLKNGHGYVCL